MDSSVSSIMKVPPCPPHENKRIAIKNDEDYDEQSSWTFYFEDFMYKDEFISCDLASDASGSPSLGPGKEASLVARKSVCKSNGRNLSFKRQRTMFFCVDSYDDDLEDTASSPVNSPKASFLNQRDMSVTRSKENNYVNYPKEEENVCGQILEKSVVLHVGDKDNSYTELKKRGLCLVPVSMLANVISN